jgi:RNA polymerase sigma-70 factor (ECF subfamily)
VDDDQALLDGLRSGDERAFETLVARYDGGLRRVARTFVRVPSAVDDVVQETWLGVLRGLHRFEGRSSLRTWIFSILVNQARTRAKRDARSLPFSSLETDEGPSLDPAAFGGDGRWASAPPRLDGDPETGLLSGELRAQLLRAVEELSDEQRAVITLRDLVGCTAPEVCALLDISDGNQRVLLHRARTRVRNALAPVVEVTS